MSPAQHILRSLVQLYRWTLAPARIFIFGPLAQCRFTPSCSRYALEAIETHGSIRGSWLAVKRICRCHPWGGCGHDPVPEKNDVRSAKCEVRSAKREVQGSMLNVQRSTLKGQTPDLARQSATPSRAGTAGLVCAARR